MGQEHCCLMSDEECAASAMLCSIVLPWGAITAVGRTEKVVGKKLEAAVAVAAPVG